MLDSIFMITARRWLQGLLTLSCVHDSNAYFTDGREWAKVDGFARKAASGRYSLQELQGPKILYSILF